MDVSDIIDDKSLKAKTKAERIAALLVNGKLNANDLVKIAKKAGDVNKATLIEALTFATKQVPAIAGLQVYKFLSESLAAEAPRVKWESARAIANIAHLYPAKSGLAIPNLLTNTEHPGTVVRWCAATALAAIITTKHRSTLDLVPVAEVIIRREEDNAIKKIYQKALKAVSR
jgi:hypothetical protein